MAGKAGSVLGLVDGLAVDEFAEAPAAGGRVLFRVLDHELDRWWRGRERRRLGIRAPACASRRALRGRSRPGTAASPSPYALIATSLPRMARSSSKGSPTWDGAISCHCRYPSGIVTPKIGDAPSVIGVAPCGEHHAAKTARCDGGRGDSGHDRLVLTSKSSDIDHGLGKGARALPAAGCARCRP